jgi:RNA polymerase sigma-70 factor, ECF subfamily
MLRSLAGDNGAHSVLLGEFSHLLRGYYARRLGRDHAESEDLVQETLIAIHNRRESWDSNRPFTPWAYAIAKYKLNDHLRKHYNRRSVSLDEISELFSEDTFDAATAVTDLEKLMKDLPEGMKASIRLVKLEGFSVVEAAKITGQSPASVKVGAHRGLKRVIAQLRSRADNADQ